MVRFASIRLILAMVAYLDLELFQVDVKTTFLNRELDEEIYMDQPLEFVSRKKKQMKRVLYASIVGSLI